MSRRRRFGGWILLWALLQVTIPSVATYADALIKRSAAGATVAHVESGTHAGCRPTHPAECALCQIVLRLATASTPACLPSILVVGAVPREPLAGRQLTTTLGWLPPSRAPPTA